MNAPMIILLVTIQFSICARRPTKRFWWFAAKFNWASPTNHAVVHHSQNNKHWYFETTKFAFLPWLYSVRFVNPTCILCSQYYPKQVPAVSQRSDKLSRQNLLPEDKISKKYLHCQKQSLVLKLFRCMRKSLELLRQFLSVRTPGLRLIIKQEFAETPGILAGVGSL